jgi:flagellar basal body-associated protein FliL
MRAGMKARMSKSERVLSSLEEPALESVGKDRKLQIKFQLSSNGLPRFAFAAPILEEKARVRRKKHKKIIIFITLIIIALVLIYTSFFIS